MTRLVAIFHDEMHSTFIGRITMEGVRWHMGAVKPLIDEDKTCSFRDGHSGHPDFTPTGTACGAPATHFILWDDARWSLGCEKHLGPFDDPAPPCVIIPLESE